MWSVRSVAGTGTLVWTTVVRNRKQKNQKIPCPDKSQKCRFPLTMPALGLARNFILPLITRPVVAQILFSFHVWWDRWGLGTNSLMVAHYGCWPPGGRNYKFSRLQRSDPQQKMAALGAGRLFGIVPSPPQALTHGFPNMEIATLNLISLGFNLDLEVPGTWQASGMFWENLVSAPSPDPLTDYYWDWLLIFMCANCTLCSWAMPHWTRLSKSLSSF